MIESKSLADLVGHAVIAKRLHSISCNQLIEIEVCGASRGGLVKVRINNLDHMTWVYPDEYEIVEDLGYCVGVTELIEKYNKDVAMVRIFEETVNVKIINPEE